MIAAMAGFGLFAILIAFLLLAGILWFEIWMFLDALKNKHLSDEERAIWIVGMLLIHPFVALVYYFTRSSNKLT